MAVCVTCTNAGQCLTMSRGQAEVVAGPLLLRAGELHGLCRGSTWCVCQHKLRSVLAASGS